VLTVLTGMWSNCTSSCLVFRLNIFTIFR